MSPRKLQGWGGEKRREKGRALCPAEVPKLPCHRVLRAAGSAGRGTTTPREGKSRRERVKGPVSRAHSGITINRSHSYQPRWKTARTSGHLVEQV